MLGSLVQNLINMRPPIIMCTMDCDWSCALVTVSVPGSTQGVRIDTKVWLRCLRELLGRPPMDLGSIDCEGVRGLSNSLPKVVGPK